MVFVFVVIMGKEGKFSGDDHFVLKIRQKWSKKDKMKKIAIYNKKVI